jgi:type I restriction enzyme S subunit
MSALRSSWPEVTLGDVCEFKYGKSLPESARAGGDVPVFGSNGQVGSHDEALTTGPTIVIGRKGSFGEVNFSSGPCWPIDTTYYVDGSGTDVDLRWLAYRLTALGLNKLNRAAAVPGLNREDAYRQRLLLPPIREQRRIAEILDKADVLRAKRRAALAQLDTLTQSIFLDMFGDPATNPKGWPVRTFDETMRDETSRAEKLQRSDYLPEGRYPVVDQGQSVIAGYCDDDRYLCPSELPVVVFGDHTRAVKLVRHRFVVGADGAKVLAPELGVDAVYLSYLMRELPIPDLGYSRHMREVKRLAFPIPPSARQQEFAQRVASIEMHCKAHNSSRLALDSLFAVLQHRAFRGEL